jgi:hypothetical protein
MVWLTGLTAVPGVVRPYGGLPVAVFYYLEHPKLFAQCLVMAEKINLQYVHFVQILTYHHQRMIHRIKVDDFSQNQLFLKNSNIRIEQFHLFKTS